MTMARRPNQFLQERVVVQYDHPQFTDDATVKLWQPDRTFRVRRVWYNNPTGLAASATDFFDLTVQNDDGVTPVTIATRSTASVALDADTPEEFPLSGTDANLVIAAGDTLSVLFDETAATAAVLPPGRFMIEGDYVD